MSVTVEIRNVYGNDLIYPADDTARKFADLIGRKTFDKYHLRLIKQLGFDIKVATYDFEGSI